MTDKKNYFLGIDLGTTNSLMSWGSLDQRTNQVDTKLVQINQKLEGGGLGKTELIPSYVYFKDNSPTVGEYAKSMIGKQTHKVIRSVKSFMGTNEVFLIDEQEYKPEYVSSLILKQIKDSASKFFGYEPEDVIITVPASFDSDMRNATINAAELAGFKIKNDDGSFRNILLDEPRASLYDFINRQNKGEIPSTLISFEEPKNVLVFDLGGGTLDVSLHEVFYNAQTNQIDIEDLAISRYTQIGGDNFDELLAAEFLEKFSEKIDLSTLDELSKSILFAEFRAIAENAKIDLTSEIENRAWQGRDVDNINVEILRMITINDKIYSFEYDLARSNYEEIVSNLLGNNFTYEDIDKFADFISPIEINNIVYPVLDVLYKAKKALGQNPDVDAVLLNGGMTKLPCIRERITKFFNLEPLTVGEPDRSVARGAVVYHYNLHRGMKPKSSILAESIGIEIVGNFVKQLVPAGTVLPFKSEIIKDFVIPKDGVCYIDIPFYRGERRDINPPNKKLLERRVHFPNPLKQGQQILTQVSVNEDKTLSFEGWLPGKEEDKFKVELLSIDTSDDSECQQNNVPNLPSKKPDVDLDMEDKTKPALEIKTTVNSLIQNFDKYYNAKDDLVKKPLMQKIKETESSIRSSGNWEEFIEPLTDKLSKTNNFGKGRLFVLLGDLGCRCTDNSKIKNLFQSSVNEIMSVSYKHPTVVKTVTRYAIETIGKLGQTHPNLEDYLVKLLYKPEVDAIKTSIITTLGKVGKTNIIIEPLNKLLKSTNRGIKQNVTWALGRIGSREKNPQFEIKLFENIIPVLCKYAEEEEHSDTRRNSIYALGEICDRRSDCSKVDDKKAISIIKLLEGVISQLSRRGSYMNTAQEDIIIRFAQLAINMIEGKVLSQDDERILLGIRTLMAVPEKEHASSDNAISIMPSKPAKSASMPEKIVLLKPEEENLSGYGLDKIEIKIVEALKEYKRLTSKDLIQYLKKHEFQINLINPLITGLAKKLKSNRLGIIKISTIESEHCYELAWLGTNNINVSSTYFKERYAVYQGVK